MYAETCTVYELKERVIRFECFVYFKEGIKEYMYED